MTDSQLLATRNNIWTHQFLYNFQTQTSQVLSTGSEPEFMFILEAATILYKVLYSQVLSFVKYVCYSLNLRTYWKNL
jgi:hypothetical protein